MKNIRVLSIRTLGAATILAFMLAIAGHAAQDPPSFRGRVDLLTIDVTAVDSQGRPVADLGPGDFTVRVDGRSRPVVSAQVLKIDRGTEVTSSRPGDALISTNTAAPQNARRIIVAVDQTWITPGLITPLLRTASQFVERLTPSDYAAFVAFPEPGPRVDFTTDKARVIEVMKTLVGQPAQIDDERINLSLSEAIDITGREAMQAKVVSSLPPPSPLGEASTMQRTTLERVVARECGKLGVLPTACRQEIYNRSIAVVANARRDASLSVRALEGLLKDLALLEGPKSMIVFSAGVFNDDTNLLQDVARLAAAARTTIQVIAVYRDSDPVRADASRQSAPIYTPRDRALEMAGLELIADNTGGTLFNGIGAANGVFKQLESELSAWYLVAVERKPDDPDRQRIEVSVKRRGVSVRSNRTAVATAVNAKRPAGELLSDMLSSPFAIPGIPLRLSTYAARDAQPGKHRVWLTADIGQPHEPAGEFAVGILLANERGRAIATSGSRRTLTPLALGPAPMLHYDTVLTVEPGIYWLRFGVVGADGRRGTAVHRIEVPETRAESVAWSDLLVGNAPSGAEAIRPTVEPQITTRELAGYLELYVPDADAERVTVTLEIAEGESSPALAMGPLALRMGDAPGRRIATGAVTVTVAPGRYLARASIRRDGQVIKTLVRPISVVREPAIVADDKRQ